MKTQNRLDLIVHDITKVEIGRFNGTTKKIIYGKYKHIDMFVMRDMVSNTSFSDDLINSYILLSRRCGCYYKRGDLENALFENIKINILKEFFNQNKSKL